MEGFGRVNGVMIDGADTRGLARVPLLRVQRIPDESRVISPSEAS